MEFISPDHPIPSNLRCSWKGDPPQAGETNEAPIDDFHCSELRACQTHPAWWLNPTPLKNKNSSIGMMTFPISGKGKMFQTTNQHQFIVVAKHQGTVQLITHGLAFSIHFKDTSPVGGDTPCGSPGETGDR